MLRAGINDFGGISPVSPDYINPRHPWPHLDALAATCARAGYLLRPRLPIYEGFARRGAWFQAFVAGTTFLAVLIAVQWPFGSFLVSPLARNGIFGMTNFPYQEPISMHQLAYQFRLDSSRSIFYMGMGAAWIAAFLSTRVGLAFGSWLLRIRR